MNIERPAKGDTVQYNGTTDMVGVVFETFYQNGQGGMHVLWTRGERSWPSWASCDRVTVTKRAVSAGAA